MFSNNLKDSLISVEPDEVNGVSKNVVPRDIEIAQFETCRV